MSRFLALFESPYQVGSSVTPPNGALLGDADHVFAIEWVPGRIDWWVDSTKCFSVKTTDLAAGNRWTQDVGPLFVILNLAVGDSWPGNPNSATVFPAELRIDYVRHYARLPRSALWPMTPTP